LHGSDLLLVSLHDQTLGPDKQYDQHDNVG
jgi:hypothetical protein